MRDNQNPAGTQGHTQEHCDAPRTPLPPQTLPLSSYSFPGPRLTSPSAPAWPGHPGQSPCAAGAASCGPAGPWCCSLGTRGRGERQPGHPKEHIPFPMPRQGPCAPVPTHVPAVAAATVAGEAPARRSWFCREKSMLYHSEERSAGFGGITRLGFSRTSRICQGGHRDLGEAHAHRDI